MDVHKHRHPKRPSLPRNILPLRRPRAADPRKSVHIAEHRRPLQTVRILDPGLCFDDDACLVCKIDCRRLVLGGLGGHERGSEPEAYGNPVVKACNLPPPGPRIWPLLWRESMPCPGEAL